MCDFNKGFVLCTCENEEKPILHNKNSRKHKNQPKEIIYRWYLYDLEEVTWLIAVGLYRLPSDDLGQGLTQEWVLLHLNHEQCFDFAYLPKEGDNLVIRKEQEGTKFYDFMSFIFKSGAWVEGEYDGISHLTKLNKKGKIKAESH
jgi:hypothetical protein